MLLGLQDEVVSSERDDPWLSAAAGDLGQTVRVQASAGEHVPAAQLLSLQGARQQTHGYIRRVQSATLQPFTNDSPKNTFLKTLLSFLFV